MACLAALLLPGRPALAYIEAPFTLGKLIGDSTNVVVITVEKVDKEKNLIIYRKVRDVKGTHPGETIKHNIGRGGFNPREWQNIMAWAEVGKNALFFHNGGAGETCIDGYWYQVYAGEWWGMSHGEPYLLRSYAGKPEKCTTAVAAMLAGQEVVVPCMVDGDKNALQLRTAKLQRMKASLTLQDYNPQRDFMGWGVEDFAPIGDMPGFTHLAALGRVSPGAAGASTADFDGDGKADVCLAGATRVVLLQNAGGSLNEVPLGVEGGAYSAAWDDFNGDGKPDLLLATPSGPRLLANEGGKLKDVSGGLPPQNYCNTRAAAWIDYNGDKLADILLADGFRGLRLYRSLGNAPARRAAAGMGKWYFAGPFDNANGAGFATVYPPEREIDLKKEYPGKNNEKVAWKEGSFTDGQVNSLALFKPELNDNSCVYICREMDFGGPTELPVSFGSDDTLTVWLNGKPIIAENTSRGCAPDSHVLTLNLQAGRNTLLLKVCNGSGDFAFYFAAKESKESVPLLFEDVSDALGLGASGVGGALRGDHLAVADVNGDGRPDILFSAGNGLLLLNTPQGFVEAKDSGIAYLAGGVAPVFGDFNGDKAPDLFVPQAAGQCTLFANDGKGHFSDVTAKAGSLAQTISGAVCAVWSDFCGSGRPDLLIGCLRGPNRYFRNKGDGTFADATDDLGLYHRIFNTRGLCVLDINNDGVPDVIFNNEAQDAAALLGARARMKPQIVADK